MWKKKWNKSKIENKEKTPNKNIIFLPFKESKQIFFKKLNNNELKFLLISFFFFSSPHLTDFSNVVDEYNKIKKWFYNVVSSLFLVCLIRFFSRMSVCCVYQNIHSVYLSKKRRKNLQAVIASSKSEKLRKN